MQTLLGDSSLGNNFLPRCHRKNPSPGNFVPFVRHWTTSAGKNQINLRKAKPISVEMSQNFTMGTWTRAQPDELTDKHQCGASWASTSLSETSQAGLWLSGNAKLELISYHFQQKVSILTLRVLCIDTPQTADFWSKARSVQMDFLSPYSVALSHKDSTLPICYCRYFWILLFLFICSSLGFYCQVFSLHLYVQSLELQMQKLITLRLLCVDEHSLWGQAACGSFQHHGQANLLSCDQGNWETALHKVPGAPARGTECSLVPVVYPQLQHGPKHVTKRQEERI